MTTCLRSWSPVVAACVAFVAFAPRAAAVPLQFVELLREARALVSARAASLAGMGACPGAVLVSEASAPSFAAAFARLEPPKAGKLDLSAWLIEDGSKMATLQENSSEYAACVHALVVASRTP